MSEEKDKALDELVSWAEVACDALEHGEMPSANTINELRAAVDAAWKVNDYKKGEPI